MLHINTITILMTNVSQRFSHLRKSYTNAVLRAIFYQVLLQNAIVHIHFGWLIHSEFFPFPYFLGEGRGGGGLSHPSLYPD